MADKGLGMGLGALFGDAANERDFDYIQISKIEPRRDQPRTVFDDERLMELRDSIAEHGVLQPLSVRAIDSGYYQIIAGERRWRAARLAGLTELPVRIIEADDRKATELALVENLQREDLNPVEEALGYKSLLDEFGLTQEELARRIGKSRPAIANSLRLLSLPKEVLKLLEDGKLSAGAARAILSLKDEQRMADVGHTASERDMSVREVEELVKTLGRAQAPPPKRAHAPEEVDYVAEAERQLTGALGRRVKISGRGNKGRIEIEYYNREDFDSLFEFLASAEG